MRIDLNHGPQVGEANSSPSQKAAAAPRTAPNRGAGDDQAELSTAGAQVQALVGQASQLPDVRLERVQSLRQAILNGSYRPGAEPVAHAVFDHMAAGSAA